MGEIEGAKGQVEQGIKAVVLRKLQESLVPENPDSDSGKVVFVRDGVIAALDELIPGKGPEEREELFTEFALKAALYEMGLQGMDAIPREVAEQYALKVLEMKEYLEGVIREAVENARKIGETVDQDNLSVVNSRLQGMRSSQPLEKVPLHAWAEAVARRNFPPPQGEYDRQSYEELIAAEKASILAGHNASMRNTMKVNELADPEKLRAWHDIKLDPRISPNTQERLENTLSSGEERFLSILIAEEEVEAENASGSGEERFLRGGQGRSTEPKPSETAENAYNLYRGGNIPRLLAYVDQLTPEQQKEALGYIAFNAALSRISLDPSVPSRLRKYMSTQIRERLKSYVTEPYYREEIDMVARIQAWRERTEQYRKLQKPRS